MKVTIYTLSFDTDIKKYLFNVQRDTATSYDEETEIATCENFKGHITLGCPVVRNAKSAYLALGAYDAVISDEEAFIKLYSSIQKYIHSTLDCLTHANEELLKTTFQSATSD